MKCPYCNTAIMARIGIIREMWIYVCRAPRADDPRRICGATATV